MANEIKNKPMIRHCKNCQWSGGWFGGLLEDITCSVKYGHIDYDCQRFTALFCRHYKKREQEKDNAE